MSTMMKRSAWVTEKTETLDNDTPVLEQRRGRWSEAEDGFEALFCALDRAVELTCDDEIQNQISDLYCHLIGECEPSECAICAEQITDGADCSDEWHGDVNSAMPCLSCGESRDGGK